MVHSRKLTAKDRAEFAAQRPEEHAATLVAEEKFKQLYTAGALSGIMKYGTLPPRTKPAPEGRPRDPITGAF